jgi:hypothetical protein
MLPRDAPATAAPLVLSPIPDWNGSSSIGDFGAFGFSAWDQTFTTPAGTNQLLDFTFVVSDAIQGNVFLNGSVQPSTPVPVAFQAHLVEFDPATRLLVGPVLYSSGEVTVPLTDSLEFHSYTFTPNAALTAGWSYLMFLFANNFNLGLPNDSRLRMASANANTYDGGSYNIHFPADGDFDSLFNGPWAFRAGDDFAFSATFDSAPRSVPEPVTLALCGGGFAAAWARRRRRA